MGNPQENISWYISKENKPHLIKTTDYSEIEIILLTICRQIQVGRRGSSVGRAVDS